MKPWDVVAVGFTDVDGFRLESSAAVPDVSEVANLVG